MAQRRRRRSHTTQTAERKEHLLALEILARDPRRHASPDPSLAVAKIFTPFLA
jgi:hypothetical protein